jgi:ribonuclease E
MHGGPQPHVEQIAITESAHDHAPEAHEAMADEAAAEASGGFAAEPRERRDDPRRDDRRRRRGRRGGRRNRQRNGETGYAGPEQSGHDAQDDFAPAEQLTVPASTEPELSHAVADLDSPPSERAAPPEVSSATPPAMTEHPETPRRRSTVREPAPMASREAAEAETAGEHHAGHDPAAPAPSPAQEPVITETGEASEGERPRRTGWWSRRFAGG